MNSLNCSNFRFGLIFFRVTGGNTIEYARIEKFELSTGGFELVGLAGKCKNLKDDKISQD